MYLWTGQKRGGKSNRGKTKRLRAKLKAKNRRRVNRMHGRKLGSKLSKAR
jgi:hypothetical protein